jgi:LPS export ABC transporter protein LptC
MRLCSIVLVFFLTGCINKMQDINAIYLDSNIHDSGKNIEFSYYLKGDLEFTLIAPELKSANFPEDKNIFPKGINIYVFNNYLDTIATIQSDFAIQDKNSDLVEASKNVILKNNNKDQLNTEQLFWNQKTKQIYTDEFVTLSTQDQLIMGFGFVADENFSTYSLTNITATIYL